MGWADSLEYRWSSQGQSLLSHENWLIPALSIADGKDWIAGIACSSTYSMASTANRDRHGVSNLNHQNHALLPPIRSRFPAPHTTSIVHGRLLRSDTHQLKPGSTCNDDAKRLTPAKPRPRTITRLAFDVRSVASDPLYERLGVIVTMTADTCRSVP